MVAALELVALGARVVVVVVVTSVVGLSERFVPSAALAGWVVVVRAGLVEVVVVVERDVTDLAALVALAVEPGISVAIDAPIAVVPSIAPRATEVVVKRTRRAT